MFNSQLFHNRDTSDRVFIPRSGSLRFFSAAYLNFPRYPTYTYCGSEAMEVIVSWQRSPEQGAEWTAFPREASAAIEESFSSGAADHSLVATATSINFATMRDTSGARIRRLTNKIVPDQRWEYQEGSFWMDYSVEQCEQINIAHERGRPQTVLYSGTNGSMAVVVNLLDRTQTNRAANTTSMIRFVISAAPRGEKRLALVSKVMDSASIVPGCTDSCSICLDEFTGSDKETAARY